MTQMGFAPGSQEPALPGCETSGGIVQRCGNKLKGSSSPAKTSHDLVALQRTPAPTAFRGASGSEINGSCALIGTGCSLRRIPSPSRHRSGGQPLRLSIPSAS